MEPTFSITSMRAGLREIYVMNILQIYAHFEERSFNAAMKVTAKRFLEAQGHQIDCADLYTDGFDPCPNPLQFIRRTNPYYFNLMDEQAHAQETDTVPPDVAAMQVRIDRAHILLFQFPMWWWSMPAILKGWIDRVFANGYAYGDRDLSGKLAMLCLTADTKAKRFAPDADFPLLRHIEFGMLAHCGLTVLPAFVVPEVSTRTEAARRAALDGLKVHIGRWIPASAYV